MELTEEQRLGVIGMINGLLEQDGTYMGALAELTTICERILERDTLAGARADLRQTVAKAREVLDG